jgi:ketosteroid isomerase-like protein
MTPDEEALRAVNQSFYGAIEEADIVAMRRVWSPEQVITCVHPRCEIITGWDDVIESWRILLEEIVPWHISVEEQRLTVRGDLGCIICLERYEIGDSEDDGDTVEMQPVRLDEPAEAGAPADAATETAASQDLPDEDAVTRLVVATHVFFREEGEWRLAHRHASAYTEDEPASDEQLN